MPRHDDLDSRATMPIPMTAPEWQAWASKSRQFEWEDGWAIPLPPPAIRDARARLTVAVVPGSFVEERRLGTLFIAPSEMRLGRCARQPDVVAVTAANLARPTEERLEGPADQILEVVADDSEHRDRVTKFAEYADAGVSEYWIGDPRPGRGTLDGFALGSARYAPLRPDPAGRMPSLLLPGVRFDPARFRERAPDLQAAPRSVLPERCVG